MKYTAPMRNTQLRNDGTHNCMNVIRSRTEREGLMKSTTAATANNVIALYGNSSRASSRLSFADKHIG